MPFVQKLGRDFGRADLPLPIGGHHEPLERLVAETELARVDEQEARSAGGVAEFAPDLLTRLELDSPLLELLPGELLERSHDVLLGVELLSNLVDDAFVKLEPVLGQCTTVL